MKEKKIEDMLLLCWIDVQDDLDNYLNVVRDIILKDKSLSHQILLKY